MGRRDRNWCIQTEVGVCELWDGKVEGRRQGTGQDRKTGRDSGEVDVPCLRSFITNTMQHIRHGSAGERVVCPLMKVPPHSLHLFHKTKVWPAEDGGGTVVRAAGLKEIDKYIDLYTHIYR